jgi:formate dehydrogenase (coenzyme F420) beta subunit
MQPVTVNIRKIARKLLENQEVDLVIGYERGSLPLRSTPCFVRTLDNVDKLIWDGSCENNLVRFLRKRKGRAAVVAKGCDAGSLVSLIKENQLERDQVYIIGVPCHGVIDRKKVLSILGGREIQTVEEIDDILVVGGYAYEVRIPKGEVLFSACITCRHKTPVIYDVLVADPVAVGETSSEYEIVVSFEARMPDERWTYFMEEVSRCIRCYACRNVCPVCYCSECFVDCSKPHWIGKTTNLSDTALYHITRTFHTAGRCTDCGACVRACPMNLDLRLLTKKMEMDIQDLFEYRAGESLESASPLTTYSLDDPQDFIW